MRAITALKNYKGEIKTSKDLDKVKDLAKGSIREKIIEYIETNHISEVDKITNESAIIQNLLNIYGVGPSKANELVNEHNNNLTNENQKNALLNRMNEIGAEISDILSTTNFNGFDIFNNDSFEFQVGSDSSDRLWPNSFIPSLILGIWHV